MARPIEIRVADAGQAVDLVRALAVRGLAAYVPAGGRGVDVLVPSRHEEPRRLLADLLPALEAWSDDRGAGPLRLRVGEEVRILGPAAAAAGEAPRLDRALPHGRRFGGAAGESTGEVEEGAAKRASRADRTLVTKAS